MTPLQAVLSGLIVPRVGWMLVHSLWQLVLVALVAGVLLFFLRRRSASARYAVSCVAMVLMATLPGVTLWQMAAPPVAIEAGSPPAMGSGLVFANVPTGLHDGASDPPRVNVTSVPPLPWQTRVVGWLEANIDGIVAAWLVGVTVLSLRIVGGWIGAQRLRRRGCQSVASYWQERVAGLARRIGVNRSVQLLESGLAGVPTVIGHLRPVILLPVAALAGLAPQQVEAILAHELAHIRRHDYLVNLVQVVIETLLFYHPAVWWVSQRIRIERENCCDDVAVRVCGDRVGYIRSLVSLEELRDAPAPRLAVAWQGTSLVDRARRLLGVPAPRSLQSGRWMAGPAVLMVGLIAAAMLLVASPSKAEPQADATKDGAAATQATEGSSDRAIRAGWQHYVIKKTATNKDGQEVREISYVLPKEYEPKKPDGPAEQVKLQIWFIRAFARNDLSAVAKVLGKSSAGKLVAGRDSVLARGEYVVLTDEQLQQLLAAARKWGGEGMMELPVAPVIPNRGAIADGEDRGGLDVLLREQNGQDESRFQVLRDFRLGAKAEITPRSAVKLDCLLHIIEGGHSGPRSSDVSGLMQTTARAAVEIPSHSAVVMPMSTDSLRLTAYRKRAEGDKPGVDLYMEPSASEQSTMTGFAIIRPRIARAGGSATQPGDDEFVLDDSALRASLSPRNAKLAQIDITTAKLEDIVRTLGEPDAYIYGNETFSKDDLPDYYCMVYPDGFSVYMGAGHIEELRFENDPSYVHATGLHVGSSMEDVFKAIGPPSKTVVGEELRYEDGVYYKDADGRKGCGYYARAKQGLRMFVMNDKVMSLYVTQVHTPMPVISPEDATAFNADLEAKVAQVDANHAKREDILRIFGEPIGYFNGDHRYAESELPESYIMQYPAGVQVFVSKDVATNLGFTFIGPVRPNYAYRGKLKVDASLEEALEVIGQPDRVVDGGKITGEDGVLYKNADGRKGFGSYGRAKQGVKVYLWSGRVSAIYVRPDALAQPEK